MVPTTVRPPTALVNNTWLVPWVLPKLSPPRMTWLPTAPPGETAPFTLPRNGGCTKPPPAQAAPRQVIAATDRVRKCDAILTPRGLKVVDQDNPDTAAQGRSTTTLQALRSGVAHRQAREARPSGDAEGQERAHHRCLHDADVGGSDADQPAHVHGDEGRERGRVAHGDVHGAQGQMVGGPFRR